MHVKYPCYTLHFCKISSDAYFSRITTGRSVIRAYSANFHIASISRQWEAIYEQLRPTWVMISSVPRNGPEIRHEQWLNIERALAASFQAARITAERITTGDGLIFLSFLRTRSHPQFLPPLIKMYCSPKGHRDSSSFLIIAFSRFNVQLNK